MWEFINYFIYKQNYDKDYYYLHFYCQKKIQVSNPPYTLSLLPNQSTLKLPQEIVQVFNFFKSMRFIQIEFKFQFLSHKIKHNRTVLYNLFFQINSSQSLKLINPKEINISNYYKNWEKLPLSSYQLLC